MGKKSVSSTTPESQSNLSAEAARRMLHELQVHQTQLQMQNEELRRVQAELEASRALYFDFYNSAPVGYLAITAKGLIAQANLTIAKMLELKRLSLLKRKLSFFILEEDQAEYSLRLDQLFATGEMKAL